MNLNESNAKDFFSFFLQFFSVITRKNYNNLSLTYKDNLVGFFDINIMVIDIKITGLLTI